MGSKIVAFDPKGKPDFNLIGKLPLMNFFTASQISANHPIAILVEEKSTSQTKT